MNDEIKKILLVLMRLFTLILLIPWFLGLLLMSMKSANEFFNVEMNTEL